MNFTSDDLSSVEVFDPEVGLWHAMPNMLLPRSGPGAYGVGSTLTVCGGGWHTSIRFCETYDTTQGYEGTWQEGPAHMIEGRRNFAYTNIGPVLFAIGGYNNTYLTTAERWSFDVYLPTIMR